MNNENHSITAKAKARIGIIGGGLAGATVAIKLGQLGLDVTLIEKGPTLVNGPPICHLHAGGNLYREISEKQCITLLNESIALLRLYPNAVDYRPTVIAVPKDDNSEPQALIPRLELLKNEYQRLITKDSNNEVLGTPEQYFKLFNRDQIEALKNCEIVDKPKTLEQWMIPVAHHVDLTQLKFPIVMVQEYGINLFRLAATAELALQKIDNCSLLTNTNVTAIQSLAQSWKVDYQFNDNQLSTEFDFLVNAAGFRTGLVDDMLGFSRQRLVEFKAAYVTKWQGSSTVWPELVFFGERGTPSGMAQFTPYPDGYFQLHGMTESITLFEKGLVESSPESAQPQLPAHLIKKIDTGWSDEQINKRSQDAIDHLSRFIPEYCQHAIVAAKPLFGAQQIPGGDADLRAAAVSFVGNHYARCEIVKASSAPSAADEIVNQLFNLGVLNHEQAELPNVKITTPLLETDIEFYAQQICENRHYPTALARCNISHKA